MIFRTLFRIGLSIPSFGGAHPDALIGPVDVAKRRAMFNLASPPQACPPPRPLPQVLDATQFYTDPPFFSKADPVKQRQFQEQMAPVREAEEAIARAITGFVKADPDHAQPYQQCVRAHILRFARDNALVKSADMRSTAYVRLLAAAPIFAYILLKDDVALPAKEMAAVEHWIRKITKTILLGRQKYWYGNNIDDWGAAALAAASIALQDKALLGRAILHANKSLEDITTFGFLASEMRRGDRALQYNLFAMQALSIIYAIARRNEGRTSERLNDAAYHRLADTLIRAVAEPDWFASLTKRPESVSPDKIDPSSLGWLTLAAERRNDAELQSIYRRYRPFHAWRAGGEWEALFGDPSYLARMG